MVSMEEKELKRMLENEYRKGFTHAFKIIGQGILSASGSSNTAACGADNSKKKEGVLYG